MKRLALLVLVAGCCFLALACGGDGTGVSTPSLTGTWLADAVTFEVELSLVEAGDGTLSGTGRTFDETQSVALTVTGGEHRHPLVSIDLRSEFGVSIGYAGSLVATDTLALAVVSGFGDPRTFVRQ